MTSPTPPIEVAFDVSNRLGEGPIWDHRIGELVWVDIDAGELWSGPPGGPARVVVTVDGDLAAVALGPDSAYLLAIDTDVMHFHPETGAMRMVDRVAVDGTRLNDGAVDSSGRWWIGSMALDHGPGRASLYRLSVDGRDEVLTGVGISNGIGWSADGTRMYYTDTLTRRVDVFDYDLADGTAHGRRPFVTIDETAGYPDGLMVDDEDRIWVALWSGSAVRCYDRSGALVHHLRLPVSNPTSCAFGGESLTTLYVTSARADESSPEPLAGCVLGIAHIGRGRPEPEARVEPTAAAPER